MTRRDVTLGTSLAVVLPTFAAAETTPGSALAFAVTRITVPFVTDRELLPKGDVGMFGSNFPADGSTRLYRGTVDAELRDGAWVALPDSLQHAVISSADPYFADVDLRAAIEQEDAVTSVIEDFLAVGPRANGLPAGESRKIFFIHGYRNTFADSVTSAAQLAHDHGAKDILCFSWPTLNELFGYWHDQDNAPRAGVDLALLIGRLLIRLDMLGPARPRVDLVAHSMGNQVLSSAVKAVGQVRQDLLAKRALGLALLCAADEDHRALSDSRKLKALPDIASFVTVYTNKNDSALAFSSGIHGGNGRLGAAGPFQFEQLKTANVFWIDCTDVLTSEGDGASHHYFRTSAAVRNDIHQVMAGEAQDRIKPRRRIRDTNAYIIPFDPTTEYARTRGYA